MKDPWYVDLKELLVSDDKVSWSEDELTPCTPEEMRRGLKEAMARFSDLLPDDDNCGCAVCASFRAYMRGQ